MYALQQNRGVNYKDCFYTSSVSLAETKDGINVVVGLKGNRFEICEEQLTFRHPENEDWNSIATCYKGLFDQRIKIFAQAVAAIELNQPHCGIHVLPDDSIAIMMVVAPYKLHSRTNDLFLAPLPAQQYSNNKEIKLHFWQGLLVPFIRIIATSNQEQTVYTVASGLAAVSHNQSSLTLRQIGTRLERRVLLNVDCQKSLLENNNLLPDLRSIISVVFNTEHVISVSRGSPDYINQLSTALALFYSLIQSAIPIQQILDGVNRREKLFQKADK